LVGFNNTPIRGNNGRVIKETFELEIVVGIHRERMKFDIIKTSIYDVTFGLPWLKKYESDIAYKAKIIQFDKYNYNSGISVVKILSVFLTAMAAYQRRDPNSILFALIIVPAKESEAVKIPFEYRGF
jgi:hypothetical protein